MPSLRTRRSLAQEKNNGTAAKPAQNRSSSRRSTRSEATTAGVTVPAPGKVEELQEGCVVWVNLGVSFGWWPAEFRKVIREKPSSGYNSVSSSFSGLGLELKEAEEPHEFSGITLASLLSAGQSKRTDDLTPTASPSCSSNATSARTRSRKADSELLTGDTGSTSPAATKGPEYLVRFFDDDKLELCRIHSSDLILPYSCNRKVALIKEGLDRFVAGRNKKKAPQSPKASKGGGLLIADHRARQAQFYKDVEMAEVLTDNSAEVADIMSKYQVIEGREEIVMDDECQAPPKKRPKKSGRK